MKEMTGNADSRYPRQQIADTLDPNIQFTVDAPSNHLYGRMPVLDVKMWIRKDDQGTRVLHSFLKRWPASLCRHTEEHTIPRGL